MASELFVLTLVRAQAAVSLAVLLVLIAGANTEALTLQIPQMSAR
jgi:hypothetical protein